MSALLVVVMMMWPRDEKYPPRNIRCGEGEKQTVSIQTIKNSIKNALSQNVRGGVVRPSPQDPQTDKRGPDHQGHVNLRTHTRRQATLAHGEKAVNNISTTKNCRIHNIRNVPVINM